MANILVFIELEQADTALDGGDGEERIVRARASAASLHALWVGRRVASQLGATLYAMLPCVAPPSYGEDDIIAVLSRHGADKVVLTTSPSLAPPALYATHAEATFAACDRFPPQLVLLPLPAGRELGARVAFKLRARYAETELLDESEARDGNSEGIGDDDETTLHRAPAEAAPSDLTTQPLRNSTTATIDAPRDFVIEHEVFRRRYRLSELLARPQPLVLTLLGAKPPQMLGADEAEVVVVQAPSESAVPLSVAEVPAAEAPPLVVAKTVLGGGAGLDKDGFARLALLGQAIGAPVVASATACEAGLWPREHCVGLHGNSVEADVYLAFGVSGSEQHLAALAPHTRIVAINSDGEAPIFEVAHYGIIADASEIIDELLGAAAPQAPLASGEDAAVAAPPAKQEG